MSTTDGGEEDDVTLIKISLRDRLIDVEYIKLAFRWENIIFVVMAIFVIIISKFTYLAPLLLAKRSGELSNADIDLDHELTRRDNKAVALSFAAYMISVSFILSAVIDNRNDDPALAILDAMTFVVVGMLLLLIAQIINDRLILSRMLNARGLLQGNIATACVEAGGYIAASLVVSASVAGQRDNLGLDLLSALLFFVLGQTLFVAQAWVFIATAGYKVQEEVHSGNVAAGVSFGLSLATFGILLSNPIAKSDSLLALAIWGILGIVMVFIIRIIVDKAVLFGRPLRLEISDDRNWGAALIEGLATAGSVVCINVFLPEPLECLY